MAKNVISVDFDGVLHSYINPFNEFQLDPPTPGAISWLTEMAGIFDVEILSTRAKSQHGCETIWRWLTRNGLDEGLLEEIVVTDKKGMAIIYIDDRGFRFEGTFPTAPQIFALAKTWNRK